MDDFATHYLVPAIAIRRVTPPLLLCGVRAHGLPLSVATRYFSLYSCDPQR